MMMELESHEADFEFGSAMAKNEAASRETNEEVERAHEVDPPGRRTQISCECALKACGRVITITVDEYRHVRMDPRQFAVVPEHFIGDIERIVLRERPFRRRSQT